MSDKPFINIEIPENTVDLAKELYEDSLQPAVQETSKLISRLPRAINAAFSDLDRWILTRENNVSKTKCLLEQNMKNADPDKIVSPEPYVAVPAIQALSYSMDSEELRNLYANLLAKSIYADTKDSVHPAYVEIIKNLSPLDCRVFNAIMRSPSSEIGFYEMRVGDVGESAYHVMFPYVTEITIDSHEAIATSIDNLSRNKLIAPEDFHYTDDNMYLPIRMTPFYQSVQIGFPPESSTELRPYKKSIKSTSLGKAFYNVCAIPL